MEDKFSEKWEKINQAKKTADETSLFIEIGKTPVSQRQLNLFYYFLFIRDILKKSGVQNVLEIGSGRGTMSLYLKEYLNLNVSLLDNSQEAIEIAKRAFYDRGFEANFILGDAQNTKLPGTSFDAVISIGLAEHLQDTEALFKEQFRLIRNGGVMISLNVPKKFSIQFLNTGMRFFKKLFGKYQEDLKKDYFRNSLKAKDYKKIAEKSGFKNVQITYVCPFPIYTPIKISADKKITAFNKFILRIRKIFQPYPYKTNSIFSQAHFLVGWK